MKVLKILFATLLVISFSACGGSNSDSTTSSATLSIDKSTLTIDYGATGKITPTATTNGTTLDTITAVSADTSIATVSIQKMVNISSTVTGYYVSVVGVSAGTVQVTITSGSGKVEFCDVTVNAMSVPVALVINATVNGTIETGKVQWYSFDGISGSNYQIDFSDKIDDNSPYTGIVKLTVYKADKVTNYKYNSTKGLNGIHDFVGETNTGSDKFIIADATEKIFIKVEPYTASSAGSYSISVLSDDSTTQSVELSSFTLTYGSFMVQTPDKTKTILGDRDGGAKIYNTADLTSSSAQPLAVYDLGDYLFGASISSDNSKMYLVGYDTGMDVVDISDASNPTKIGTTFNDDISYYLGVTQSPNGNIAYISNRYNGILSVDISGDTPTKLGSYNTNGSAFYSVVSSDGDTLYIADESNGLVVVNISDATNPTLINSLDTDGKVYKMTLSSDNTKLYLADNSGGLKIIDVSNVTTSNAPTLLGSILPQNTTSVNYVTLNSAETMAFLACSDGGATGDSNADGLYVVDITDPTSPTLKVSQVSLYDSGKSVILSDDEKTVFLLSVHGFNAYNMEQMLAK